MSILEVFKKDKEESKDKDSKSAKATKKVAKVDDKKKTVKAKKDFSKKTDSKIAKLAKGDAYQIIVRPLITEKATELIALNQYAFEVSNRANKTEIKKAINSLYNVEPTKVRIINTMGKEVRRGRQIGKTKSWKKAIVTLKEGDKIEIFAGV